MGGLVTGMAVHVYLLASMGAAAVGGLVGLSTVWIQRRWDDRGPGPPSTSA